MEIHENEHDQVGTVRHLFAENGEVLAVGTILKVGVLVDWRYWANHQMESVHSTFLVHQNTMTAVSAGKSNNTPVTEKLATKDKDTYGALVSLELAQQFVDQSELKKTAGRLQQGLATTNDENLKAMINLRLARAQTQLEQADTTLETLNTIRGKGRMAIVADLRDEVSLSKGDKQGTRSAWKVGAKSDVSPALSEMIQMKVSSLFTWEGPDAIT